MDKSTPITVDATTAALTHDSEDGGDAGLGGVYRSGTCRANGRLEGVVSSKERGDGWCGESHEARVAELVRTLRKGGMEKEFTMQTR